MARVTTAAPAPSPVYAPAPTPAPAAAARATVAAPAVSPARQAASPARQPVSPAMQAASPARQPVSPAMQAASPARQPAFVAPDAAAGGGAEEVSAGAKGPPTSGADVETQEEGEGSKGTSETAQRQMMRDQARERRGELCFALSRSIFVPRDTLLNREGWGGRGGRKTFFLTK